MKDETGPLDEKEIEVQELERKVLNCLQESGFPFEARIAKAFANLQMDDEYKDLYVTEFGDRPMDAIGCLNRGVPVQCGVPFLDPVTNKSREFDVHSVLPLKVNNVDIWIHFFVECKNTNKVWAFGHYGFETTPTIRGKYASTGIQFKSGEAELNLTAFFPDPVLGVHPSQLSGVGKVLKKKENKGSVTLQNDSQDEIWEAALTSVKAAEFFQDSVKGFFENERDPGRRRLFVFVPMVATGNQLFFADLSGEKPEITQVDLAFYIHRSLSDAGMNHKHFVVPVITETSLSRVVNEVAKASIGFLEKYFA